MPSLDEKPLNSSTFPSAQSTTSSSDNLPRTSPPCLNTTTGKESGFSLPNHEFDPCQNAKPYSPFYNHDTPGGSAENLKAKTSLHVSVRDLEAQNALTPTQTIDARPSPGGDAGTLRPWTSSTSIFGREKSRCLTRPKPRRCSCMSNLPRRQKLLVKLLIALVIIGAMVGIGVGISLKVGGGVYKNENSTSKIGTV